MRQMKMRYLQKKYSYANYRGSFENHRGVLSKAFTLLELQVVLIVLTVSLLGIVGLVSLQSRQMSNVEQWCSSSPVYYLVSQSNRWMKQLGAPADVNDSPGQSAWKPPVSGEKEYSLQITSINRAFASNQISCQVIMEQAEP